MSISRYITKIPDNYDMWATHDNAIETKLEKLPCCAECGEHIQQEYAVRIGNSFYCDECLDGMKVPLDDYYD